MDQLKSTRTLNFVLGDSCCKITKPAEQIQALENALDHIYSLYYPIVRISEDTFKIIASSSFSAEDLFYRVMLMVSTMENPNSPKEAT